MASLPTTVISAPRVIVALVAVALALSAMGQRGGGKAGAEKGGDTAGQYERQRRFNEFFLESVVQREKGNADAAFELMRHAIEIDADAPEALAEMARMLLTAGEPDSTGKVERLARRAVELEPDNYYFQRQLAEYYERSGRSDSAVARYEAMSRQFSDRDDLLYILAAIYSSQKDYEALVATLGRIEVRDGGSDELTLRKIEAYACAGEPDSALALVNRLIDSDPENLGYRVVRGGVYGDMGQQGREIAEYTDVIEKDPHNGMANWALLARCQERGDTKAYIEKAIYMSADTNMELRFRAKALNSLVMSCSRGFTDSLAALPACRAIAAQPGADLALLDLCNVYMEAVEMPADTIAPVWRKLLTGRPDYTQVRIKLLRHSVGKRNSEETARLCDGGIEHDPENLVFYYYGGIAYHALGKYDKAAATLELGTRKIGRATEVSIASDIYSILGDIYHTLDKDSLCFNAYDSALVYRADNLGALNNYAYFLSLKRRDLAKAEAMSLRTVKAEPSNPIYLDTYAWVLFGLERYAEAATFIAEALKNIDDDKENASIYEHAGDIYWKLRKKDEAMEMWRKAREIGGASKALDRKIKLKKYVEE